jgi:hypothetical protein
METYLKSPSGRDQGESEIAFEARGDKVVAKISAATNVYGCERDVTITSDTVKFDQCLFPKTNAFRFDPNDREYPFKGTREHGYDVGLRPK